jgi:adenine-specific DNA-methyltransferase
MAKLQKLELAWIGKENQPRLEPRILIEDQEKSYGEKNADNMLIYGDNLIALKALLPTYARRVKCIYIDPPYNTGNEKWVYNDNVNSPIMQEWLGKAAVKNE